MKNNTYISTLHDSSHKIYFNCWKKLKKHVCIFTHLLLMTSYFVTIATDHHQTWLKMCARDEWTATENVRYWCFILYEKIQKNHMGGGIHLPPVPPRGLIMLATMAKLHPFLAISLRSMNCPMKHPQPSAWRWMGKSLFKTAVLLLRIRKNTMIIVVNVRCGRKKAFPWQ